MLRLISSVVGGLLLAFVIVFATDAAFHAMVADGAVSPDASDPEAMRLYVAGQPIGVLVALLAGWGIAVFTGSATASYLARHGNLPGWVITGLFLLTTLMNFVLVQHPTWMVFAGTATILLAGWLGVRLTGRTAKPGPTPIPR